MWRVAGTKKNSIQGFLAADSQIRGSAVSLSCDSHRISGMEHIEKSNSEDYLNDSN